ncbi:Z1 domain-containing protein [Peribacillus frigoritolerans]|uniref:Z1 domain-containing protein n=1 Tax=Peribacillus frigoritolerans TaxID=450367 RepID=UPI0039A38BE2
MRKDSLAVGKVEKSSKKIIKTDGEHIIHLRKALEEEISREGVSAIIRRAEEVVGNLYDSEEGNGERRGLIFGKIQSGKTNSFTTSLALAADNGYKCFVVLTSDNLWLYQQTISRLKKSLPGITIVGKEEWDHKVNAIKTRLELNGVIFVSTKNSTNLNKLVSILKETGANKYPAVIFDDEADQASLNTNAGKEDDEPSKINSLINKVRENFKIRTYVQVTATPQALFLQGVENLYRPEFTVLIEPGDGYIGGETFFADSNFDHLSDLVSGDEINSLISSKVRSINKSLPTGLKRSLCMFYVGATIKLLKGEGTHFSFLCHVSLKKADHEHIRDIIQRYTDDMAKILFNKDERKLKSLISLLEDVYNDLSNHVKNIPNFEDVVEKLSFYISSTDIQLLNTDSKNSSGQPTYDQVYNILIGGTKLGRGVTIERLLVTYYGRQAKKPQLDTVLQHARMYGYREKDLDVSRVYLPKHLAERFHLIYESETALREVITNHKDEGLRAIWLSKEIKPTRTNVLDPNELGAFAAGKSYFPHKPLYLKKDINGITEKIDTLLKDYINKAESSRVPLSLILEILRYTKTEESSPGLWQEKRISLAIEKLRLENKEAHLVVRTGRRLTRNDNYYANRGLGAVYQSNELRLASDNLPTLFMYRQEGLKGDGWDNYRFWIPVFRFPAGNYAIIFNLS